MLLIFLHGPIVYFNAKDMMLIVIAQCRESTASTFLKKLGLSNRVRNSVNVPCHSGSTNNSVAIKDEEIPQLNKTMAAASSFGSSLK